MTLEDTAAAMFSEDYKERFRAEYYQTKIRVDKMSEMMRMWTVDKLPFEPKCNPNTYLHQMAIMNSYLQVLRDRAEEEGIML
jgi:hypothetical protein